jgi:hypothetical protein
MRVGVHRPHTPPRPHPSLPVVCVVQAGSSPAVRSRGGWWSLPCLRTTALPSTSISQHAPHRPSRRGPCPCALHLAARLCSSPRCCHPPPPPPPSPRQSHSPPTPTSLPLPLPLPLLSHSPPPPLPPHHHRCARVWCMLSSPPPLLPPRRRLSPHHPAPLPRPFSHPSPRRSPPTSPKRQRPSEARRRVWGGRWRRRGATTKRTTRLSRSKEASRGCCRPPLWTSWCSG